MIANDSITALYFRGGSVRLPLRDLFCPRESSGRLLLPCQAYFIYPRKTAISPGVIAISSGEMRIYCRGMPIQFLHTEKRFTITEKPFLFFFMLHFFAFYALCGQQNYTRSAKSILPLKNNQRTLPRSWVRPSVHIMPAMQITRGLACHFSRFPPLIDNLSIKLFFVRFCALCGAFCGFWSMPHAIRV